METTISSALQVLNNEELGTNIRWIIIDGDPWFVAKDVCDCLEIANSRDAVSRLDDDELTSVKLTSGGQMREMKAVNEYGLYNLILGSRKPEAKQFKRWITHEVIPSIRKKGYYIDPNFKNTNNEIFTLFDIRCYIDENGIAHFNLKDICFALGLTKINQNGKEFVNWERVRPKLLKIKLFRSINSSTFVTEDVLHQFLKRSYKTEKSRLWRTFFYETFLPELQKNVAYRSVDEDESQPQQSKPYNFKNKSIVHLVQETFKLANTIQKQRKNSDDEALLAAIEIKEEQLGNVSFLRRLLK